jgi:signal transduction histidine kinase
MEETCALLVDAVGGLALADLDAEHFRALDGLRGELVAQPAVTSSLDLADREDELVGWFDDHGVDRGWELAPTLAVRGADPAWCDRMTTLLPERALRPGLQWVAAMLAMSSVLGDVRDATHRISELVSSVRSYTQMDRAAAQRLAVTDGIDSTLVMLGHKIGPGVEVAREFAPGLPEVEGFPGELNQVWTNLLDNAIDAVDGAGRVRIAAYGDGKDVVVEVRDTGPGMTPEVAARAFDAFFTTKDVGSGTGLGLDIAQRIVVERHGGSIEVDREGDETVFRVRLPG